MDWSRARNSAQRRTLAGPLGMASVSVVSLISHSIACSINASDASRVNGSKGFGDVALAGTGGGPVLCQRCARFRSQKLFRFITVFRIKFDSESFLSDPVPTTPPRCERLVFRILLGGRRFRRGAVFRACEIAMAAKQMCSSPSHSSRSLLPQRLVAELLLAEGDRCH